MTHVKTARSTLFGPLHVVARFLVCVALALHLLSVQRGSIVLAAIPIARVCVFHVLRVHTQRPKTMHWSVHLVKTALPTSIGALLLHVIARVLAYVQLALHSLNVQQGSIVAAAIPPTRGRAKRARQNRIHLRSTMRHRVMHVPTARQTIIGVFHVGETRLARVVIAKHSLNVLPDNFATTAKPLKRAHALRA